MNGALSPAPNPNGVTPQQLDALWAENKALKTRMHNLEQHVAGQDEHIKTLIGNVQVLIDGHK